jgi:hydroxypyruvate reductase
MSGPEWIEYRAHLGSLHGAALDAADPVAAVVRSLSLTDVVLQVGDASLALPQDGRVFLVAIGKAALGMAEAAVQALGQRIANGVVASPLGSPPVGFPDTIQVLHGGHPLPDEGSLEAGRAVETMLSGTRPGDIVLALISGGGSALAELPQPGVGLDQLRDLTLKLQRAGANIRELNTVRRGLSRLKGGGLLQLAAPARVVALLLSDVVGDDPAAVASGPVVPSPTGPAEARAVLAHYRLLDAFPDLIAARPPRGGQPAPEPLIQFVGSNRMAAEAVRAAADQLGFRARIASLFLEGEAREVGRVIGSVARTIRHAGVPLAPPACLVFGGETTVTVRGSGRGGRNSELALGAALALAGCERALVFSFATDGIDGNGETAGALAAGDTLTRARALDLSAEAAFADSDTATFFTRLGDAWTPGPSGTNVNDLVIVLVYA